MSYPHDVDPRVAQLAAKDAQIAALRAALGPLACECSGQWCERSEWRPADIEHCARRAARAALEMSGGVL